MGIRIEIPGLPPSMNQYNGRQNVWKYRRDKQEWKDLVVLHCKRQREPFEYAIVTITYYFKDKRRHDPDNYSGKFILDGLTAAGIIKDDDFKHIELRLCAGMDKKRPRTQIDVKEV